jgi:RNA polymerase sigma-70 factor (ECF subfamily)
MRAYEALEQTERVDLLARAQTGERAAFTELVERHHAELIRIAFAVTGDLEAARDAAQLAWIKAWQRLQTLREPDRLRAWLIAIAANEARQGARAHRRRRVREITPAALDQREGDNAVTSADRLDLRDALIRLAPDDRALLAMRYLAGLSADEIGTATGLSGSGVRSRLSRLVARLREELDDD